MSSNAELWARRSAAVARGVGSASQLFADRALNAEIWDVEGKRYIDYVGSWGPMIRRWWRPSRHNSRA